MIILRCKKHPRYKAIREPKCGCQGCWRLYGIASLSYINELRK